MQRSENPWKRFYFKTFICLKGRQSTAGYFQIVCHGFSRDSKLKLSLLKRACSMHDTTRHVKTVSSRKILELHNKFCYRDSDSYFPLTW